MERELKFLLDHAHLPTLPDGYHLANPQSTLHLLDEYLDFRGEISAMGWRLRRRRSDGEALRYTLKSERATGGTGPLTERIELERTPEHHEEMPAEITATLAAAGVDTSRVLARLQPYLTLRQERQPSALFRGEEEIALLCVDDVRAFASSPDQTCHWKELEIEFLESATSEMRDRATSEITAWFATQAGVAVGGEPKVDRAARQLSISI